MGTGVFMNTIVTIRWFNLLCDIQDYEKLDHLGKD